MPDLAATLRHAVTDYDRRQSKKRCYNVYALGQYLIRVDAILDDIAAGANPLDAIAAATHGPLQNHITKIVTKAFPDLPPATLSPLDKGLTYRPASQR